MFCVICGSGVPGDSKFCKECGNGPLRPGSFAGRSYEGIIAPTSEVKAGPMECPQCRLTSTEGARRCDCRFSFEKTAKNPPPNVKADPALSAPAQGRFDYGTVVFALFSALSLLACLAKGIVPLYLGESAFWAAVAWFWRKKGPRSETANVIVLLMLVGAAAVEGYLLGQQSLQKSFTYLNENDSQYRVNAGSGRTDILAGRRGWKPISFDSAAATIPNGEVQNIALSNGTWENDGKICFAVRNDSDYVLQQIVIKLNFDVPSNVLDALAMAADRDPLILEEGSGPFLLDRGTAAFFCGRTPEPPPNDAKWSYRTLTMTGWKQ